MPAAFRGIASHHHELRRFVAFLILLEMPLLFVTHSLHAVEPNQANDQWLFANGTFSLISNPNLCLTGPSSLQSGSFQLVVSQCVPNSPAQQFSYTNVTYDPFITLIQTFGTVNTNGNNLVVNPAAPGTGLAVCNAGSSSQDITFKNGQIINSQGNCLEGSCSSGSGCYPLYFTA